MDYADLTTGQEISNRTCVFDPTTVSRYLDAVGDESALPPAIERGELAPPMAVAALTLRGVLADLAIPGGTVHAGQELAFKRAVKVGETLVCRARLVQNSVRGEWRFMVIVLEASDSEGGEVMEGKSTIIVPA